MASEALFQELAKALSRPSKAYLAAQEGLSIPQSASEGYKYGADLADQIRKRRLSQQTLSDALGGGGLKNLTPEQGALHAPTIKEMALLGESQPKNELVLTQEDALKLGKIPKGTRIISPEGDSVTFIGTDRNGKPQLMDKHGNIRIGNVPGGGPVYPKGSTMPTSTTRSSSEFASALLPHIGEMRDLVKSADNLGYIGPGAGRVYGRFLAGKVGSTGDPQADELLGKLRTTDSLIKSGMLRTHFGARGGQQMYQNFSDMLNSGKQSASMINGSLNAIEGFLKGYAEAGKLGDSNDSESPDSLGLFQ